MKAERVRYKTQLQLSFIRQDSKTSTSRCKRCINLDAPFAKKQFQAMLCGPVGARHSFTLSKYIQDLQSSDGLVPRASWDRDDLAKRL
jgi:hypothetical protein